MKYLIMVYAFLAVGCSAPLIKQNNNPSLRLACQNGFVSKECEEAYEWAEH